MRCKYCNHRLAEHDLWCVNCRRQSSLVKNELSAINSLSRSWASFKGNTALNVPLAAISIIFGIIPVMVFFWLSKTSLNLPADTVLRLFATLLINTGVICFFAPFVLIGFNAVSQVDGYGAPKEQMLSAIKTYPRYLIFSLLNGAYFIIIYLICFGVPGFGSDPILRLVWLVLVNYWMAFILPVPALMERSGLSMFKAFRLAYRHFHVVRWNLYLLALVLMFMNLFAGLLFLIPLAVSLPLSWYAVRDYTDLLLEYELDRQ